jgi:hypothetical protein
MTTCSDRSIFGIDLIVAKGIRKWIPNMIEVSHIPSSLRAGHPLFGFSWLEWASCASSDLEKIQNYKL